MSSKGTPSVTKVPSTSLPGNAVQSQPGGAATRAGQRSSPAEAAAGVTSSKEPAAAGIVLSDAELIELSGDANSLDGIKQLTLRGRKLGPSFERYASRLPALEALSLSHNLLTSLHGFSALSMLTSLNVNSNRLSSLDGLQGCSPLQHLYAANNVIREITPLAALTSLCTLSLVGNAISGLDALIGTLGGLIRMTDLDLSGNPCCLVPEYKGAVLRALAYEGGGGGMLEQLDGDRLAPLDWEMAMDGYMMDGSGGQDPSSVAVAAGGGGGGGGSSGHQHGHADVLVINHAGEEQGEQRGGAMAATFNAWTEEAEGSVPSSSSSRPSPPPPPSTLSSSFSFRQGMGNDPSLLRPPTSSSSSFTGEGVRVSSPSLRLGTASRLRPGTSSSSAANYTPASAHVKLVSDGLLNDHPVLLEYLARHVLAEGVEAVTNLQQQQQHQGQVEDSLSPNHQNQASGPGTASSSSLTGRLRSTFVSRLRGTAAASAATESLPVKDLVTVAANVAAVSSSSATAPSPLGLGGGGSGGGGGGEANARRLAAAETLVMGASPQETIRQLVRLCEVLINEVKEATAAVAAAGASGGSGGHTTITSWPGSSSTTIPRGGSASGRMGSSSNNGMTRPPPSSSSPSSSRPALGPAVRGSSSSQASDGLEEEVIRLRREVKQLKQENQNVEWLAEEYKTMKAELARLKHNAAAIAGTEGKRG